MTSDSGKKDPIEMLDHSIEFTVEPTCTDEDILRWLNEDMESAFGRRLTSSPTCKVQCYQGNEQGNGHAVVWVLKKIPGLLCRFCREIAAIH